MILGLDIDMFIFLVWAIGCIVTVIPITRFFIEDKNDKVDVVLSIFMGMCCCTCWPLLIPGYWIYKVVTL